MRFRPIAERTRFVDPIFWDESNPDKAGLTGLHRDRIITCIGGILTWSSATAVPTSDTNQPNSRHYSHTLLNLSITTDHGTAQHSTTHSVPTGEREIRLFGSTDSSPKPKITKDTSREPPVSFAFTHPSICQLLLSSISAEPYLLPLDTETYTLAPHSPVPAERQHNPTRLSHFYYLFLPYGQETNIENQGEIGAK